MACILIDYENEGGRVLEGISLLGLTASDEIVLFYTKNADRMTMELHKELETIPAKKLYIRAEVGASNALDFQLSSYLGACVQKNPFDKYFIVSKDGGYECVCVFWRNKNIFVKRIDKISHYAFANKIGIGI